MTQLNETTEGEDMIDAEEFEKSRKYAMTFLAKLTGSIDQKTYNVLVDFIGRKSIYATNSLEAAESISQTLQDNRILIEQYEVHVEELEQRIDDLEDRLSETCRGNEDEL